MKILWSIFGFIVIISLLLILHLANMQLKYAKYCQREIDAAKFTVQTVCRIDGINSRPQKDIHSSNIILNNSFLVSFEVNINGNIVRKQLEQWTVPVPIESNIINTTYPCFIDPYDTQRGPLHEKPNTASIRDDFIEYILMPSSIMSIFMLFVLMLVAIPFAMMICSLFTDFMS
ncbi:unnamed protein product [Adineta ricciae]|uniref:Uncharacterized protein n=1 Tax=Adineta ricciae TaxID=249248 RepID=A0A815R4H4_ADIRI|nr:unnamed protein product [Adineta ricciae]